ncbi:MAG TPA: hypothetical protein VGO08_08870 [Burkholderiales bacterium]|nr:hypothetical protein [Burkholderiales bacterium]
MEDWPIMDADVRFEEKDILDAAQVPIENLSAHWMLDDGVLRFEPLRFRMARRSHRKYKRGHQAQAAVG